MRLIKQLNQSVLASVVVAVAAAHPALALTDTELTASRMDARRFGYDVDIDMSADTARLIVGAPSIGGHDYAFIFRRDGTSWVEEAVLPFINPDLIPFYGTAVALDDRLAAVSGDHGGPGPNFRGRVAVFRLVDGAWSEEAILAPSSDPRDAPHEDFGSDMALDGSTLMVAALSGVYVFERQRDGTWRETAKLVTDPDDPNYRRTHTVAFEEPQAIVGTPHAGDGSAHIFERSRGGWSKKAQLDAPAAAGESPEYGASVGITRDFAIVGAPQATSEMISGAGAAYLYHGSRSSWRPLTTLGPDTPDPDPTTFNDFGSAVAISGDYVVIGDRRDDEGAGAAYIYRWDGTNFVVGEPRFSPSGVRWFGRSVAIDGTHAVVGADGDMLTPGSAFVYSGFVRTRPVIEIPPHLALLREILPLVYELCPPELCCPPAYCDPPPLPEEPTRRFPPPGDPALPGERLDLMALRTMQGLAGNLQDENAQQQLEPLLRDLYAGLAEQAGKP